ncbi:hypothetical protein ASE77_15815 [Sphingomonas sp. Leaf226]|nr:hypothetical protein ASE77_15815 [Sphingomonas sp. Leaf226]
MEFLQREELSMATLPTEQSVTPLRQRMLDDMAMRSMRSRTQHDYVRHVRAFAAFLRRSPETATAEDVRRDNHVSFPLTAECQGTPPWGDSAHLLVADLNRATIAHIHWAALVIYPRRVIHRGCGYDCREAEG